MSDSRSPAGLIAESARLQREISALQRKLQLLRAEMQRPLRR